MSQPTITSFSYTQNQMNPNQAVFQSTDGIVEREEGKAVNGNHDAKTVNVVTFKVQEDENG